MNEPSSRVAACNYRTSGFIHVALQRGIRTMMQLYRYCVKTAGNLMAVSVGLIISQYPLVLAISAVPFLSLAI